MMRRRRKKKPERTRLKLNSKSQRKHPLAIWSKPRKR
jgi:hypothetical protein